MKRSILVLAAGAAALVWLGTAQRAASETPAAGVRSDVLRLSDGTVHLGTFRAFDGATIEFAAGGVTLRVPRRDVAAILLAPAGEAAASTAAPGANPEAEAVPDIGLTGVWHSPEWGAMHLVQKGRRIYGTYDWDGGQVDGFIQGDELRFWWWEMTPHGKPFANADEGQRGDGVFTIAKDGKSLSGTWRYASDIKAGQKPTATWTAQKKDALPAGFAYTPPGYAVPEGATKW